MRNTFSQFAFFLLLPFAHAQQVIPLYEGMAPGSENWNQPEGMDKDNRFQTDLVYNVAQPSITAYLPDPKVASGAAVVIAPGGGFHFLDMKYEGELVAKWLQSKGIAAFILKYRLVQLSGPKPIEAVANKSLPDLEADMKTVAPLAAMDGLRAVELLRLNAGGFNINPDQIGFLGFSAGGNVAMSVAYSATDSNRPNWVAPIYAYTGAVVGSTFPTKRMPLFIAVAGDDELGLLSYSLEIHHKWVAAKQPAELHVYEKGGHGFGFRQKGLPSDQWMDRFGEWMASQGWWDPKKVAAAYPDRQKVDWAYRSRYAEANRALGAPAAGIQRVVFLGNSIIEGWAAIKPEYFSKHNFVGRGIGGQTSPQTLIRFRQDVLSLRPVAVLLNIGTNDIAENTGPYDPEFTMGNIISICELAKANQVKVVLCSVLPASSFYWRKEVQGAPEKILALNERIKAYAKEQNLVYCDFHSALKNKANGMDASMAEDGVHPSIEAYEIMATLANEAIIKALKQ
jgi:acetyl esterase/lipase/lysophospholipase L1-like esterase